MDVLHRDHRKVLAVDSRIGFVTGLCVGDMWVGDATRGVQPWRDTGIEIRGPALCDIERAFARVGRHRRTARAEPNCRARNAGAGGRRVLAHRRQ